MVCVSSGVTTGTPSSGPNVGAIAGGVVGGVALVAIATFLLWWFWIRPRREFDEYEEDWEDDEHPDDVKSQFREDRDQRASVHTVHSVASTVMSRASNMIPIAFIPGVTNRDGTSATTPPVPPIPAARGFSPSPLSSQHSTGDAIFFSPGDLRNSAYSSTSTLDNRKTFIGRPSISPSLARESVASDVYHDDAGTNPMPAQQIIMTRPNMVSVKSASTVPTTSNSPTSVDSDFTSARTSHSPKIMIPASSNSPSISSNASFVKPNAVTILKKGGSARFPVRQPSEASTKPSLRSPLGLDTDTEDDDEDPHARARQSLLRNNSVVSSPATSTMTSPFADDASQGDLLRSASSRYTAGALSAVIEEATRRASRVPTHGGLGGEERGERDRSPFGDENATDK
ncbi:hypothetical protein CAC42_1813 [Sphaceloma murrayae]|uniref:Uncharacterized protein n=1 Tax=Sphaceloma murrayae TaxID=2082308 RepID=A0A2K1QVJ2_9PEZI|nr:hypothetical protein CAC42_1813 [Sphaceloma murrayae]